MLYDILLLSRSIPENLDIEVRSKMKNTMDDAAIAWQKHIISGLETVNPCCNTVLNFLPVKSWPNGYKDIYVKKTSFFYNGKVIGSNAPFCNIRLIKRLFQGKSLYREVKKWALNGNDNKIIIAYSLYPEFLESIKIAKKYNPQIKSSAIVLDLPQYCILTKRITLLNRLYLSWSKKNAYKRLVFLDKGILLTKSMAEVLGLNDFCIIEGISSHELLSITPPKSNSNDKIVFYAGTLHQRFGILNLIEAFCSLNIEHMKLVICGYGDSIQQIQTVAKTNKNICYLGQLPREQVLPIMLQSDIIVNPRMNVEDFTKYSFPSKNIEALSTGIPFIGYKLDGIPDEYDLFINYPMDNTKETLAELLKQICEDSSGKYLEKAARAKEWVLSQKNSTVQAQKILEFLAK